MRTFVPAGNQDVVAGVFEKAGAQLCRFGHRKRRHQPGLAPSGYRRFGHYSERAQVWSNFRRHQRCVYEQFHRCQDPRPARWSNSEQRLSARFFDLLSENLFLNLLLDDTGTLRMPYGFEPSMRIKLREDVLDVIVYSRGTDIELTGNRSRRVSLGQTFQHFDLARSEG